MVQKWRNSSVRLTRAGMAALIMKSFWITSKGRTPAKTAHLSPSLPCHLRILCLCRGCQQPTRCLQWAPCQRWECRVPGAQQTVLPVLPLHHHQPSRHSRLRHMHIPRHSIGRSRSKERSWVLSSTTFSPKEAVLAKEAKFLKASPLLSPRATYGHSAVVVWNQKQPLRRQASASPCLSSRCQSSWGTAPAAVLSRKSGNQLNALFEVRSKIRF
mmetsp:Transcript_46736/g.84372  ORF Transcript_46736/g.84372 Transcript_46736/m.84372 type:complete len:214 (-) Transcript_46736:267-908(-)